MKGVAIALACLALFASLVVWRIGATIDGAREPAQELVRISRRVSAPAEWRWLVLGWHRD